MKKFIAVLLLLVVAATMFVACNPTTCEACGAEGVSTTKCEVAGVDMYLCETCELGAAFLNGLGY